MSSMVRRASRFAITIALVAATVSCASAPPASPKLMARCTQLYALWARYEPIFTLIHTGQKAQAELAL